MSGTTHEQNVQTIREIYQEQGIQAINGLRYTLLAGGTKEAQEQFEAAAIWWLQAAMEIIARRRGR